MRNRISAVATASLASALILLLLGGRVSAAANLTREDGRISRDVCWQIRCNGCEVHQRMAMTPF